VGTLFYERAVPPRPPRVWYDRRDSAFTTLTASELDWAYLTAAQVVLMAGTAPALSPVLRKTTREIATRVRAAGCLFALDVNYRAKLWSPQEAADYFATLLPLVSILFCGQRDAARLFWALGRTREDRPKTAGSGSGFQPSYSLWDLRGPLRSPITSTGCRACDGWRWWIPSARVMPSPGIPVRLPGRGRSARPGDRQRRGALHCTILGDFAYITRAEVEELLASDDDDNSNAEPGGRLDALCQSGKAGVKVSRICLGMMSYGDKAWREWTLSEDDGTADRSPRGRARREFLRHRRCVLERRVRRSHRAAPQGGLPLPGTSTWWLPRCSTPWGRSRTNEDCHGSTFWQGLTRPCAD